MEPDLPYEVEVKSACPSCGERFDSPAALLEHEAQEDDRLYTVEEFVDKVERVFGLDAD